MNNKWTKIFLFFLTSLTILIVPGIISADTQFQHLLFANGSKAIICYPPNFSKANSYPLIIALHGMKETADDTIIKWKKTANSLNLIVIALQGSDFTEGYTREPIDDRLSIVRCRDWAVKKFNVDKTKIILAGFSRGGNFAIETGLLYPDKFPGILCLFGFFNDGMDKILDQYVKNEAYRNSYFYFLTGHGDMTEASLTQGYQLLKKAGVKSNLHIFGNLFHKYPHNLNIYIEKILNKNS